jgi:hypothetical protein
LQISLKKIKRKDDNKLSRVVGPRGLRE